MSTYTETIKLAHNYTATIALDEDAQNPFTNWDFEPPIAVLNLDRHTRTLENYDGEELSLKTLLDLIPADKWTTRQGKREILKALPFDISDLRETMRHYAHDLLDFFQDAIRELTSELAPSSWTEWQEYFIAMARLASIAGIPHHYTISHGHCQGDCALVFTAATPTWTKLVGAPEDTLAAQCQNAADLWAAWAWGDCYGIEAIHRPDGTELDDGSCWGFYGSDHAKSGLLDHCNGTVKSDLIYLAREAAAAHEAACRDIATIA